MLLHLVLGSFGTKTAPHIVHISLLRAKKTNSFRNYIKQTIVRVNLFINFLGKFCIQTGEFLVEFNTLLG